MFLRISWSQERFQLLIQPLKDNRNAVRESDYQITSHLIYTLPNFIIVIPLSCNKSAQPFVVFWLFES
jgi:hypothetical protein